ncbi:MAG: hypothetical protein OHK0046_40960 [Anaerolineae bacterium]
MDCQCLHEPLPFDAYDEVEQIGLDENKGRFGEVMLWQCKTCDRLWLRYFVEYEHRERSGRYYMGLIENPSDLAWLVPEIALPYIASLPWYLFGGSYFNGQKGRRPKGSPIVADDF